MSTFSGKIQEIPHISVDRFDENNFNSEAYFLSHCHTDHMVGLYTNNFQYNLLINKRYIYASDISCAILKRRYPALENNVKVLDIYKPTTILLDGGNLMVLPIPAGHCPGSVMFLFETNVNILYTGDFRINKSDIRKLKSFYDSYKQVKAIEKIYLDTTFFLKSYSRFPKREESLEELCKIIKEWIDKGKDYCVTLLTSARYGYEYVFKEIYSEIGMPVHVDSNAYDLYSVIPEMDNSVTLDGSGTQIHCSCGPSFKSVCFKAYNSKRRTIRISAFRWTQNNLEDGFFGSNEECDTYYVCYSTHASYEEGAELLRFLKPKGVEICVKHDNFEANSEISELIEEILDEFRPKSEEDSQPKLFETEEHVSKENLYVVENESNFDFKFLDSPPRNVEKLSRRLQANATSSIEEFCVSENNSMKFRSVEVQNIEECDNAVTIKKLDVGLETVINIEGPPLKRLK